MPSCLAFLCPRRTPLVGDAVLADDEMAGPHRLFGEQAVLRVLLGQSSNEAFRGRRADAGRADAAEQAVAAGHQYGRAQKGPVAGGRLAHAFVKLSLGSRA